MSKFFFNISDGVRSPDCEGVELPDLEAAKRSAVEQLANTLLGDPDGFWKDGALSIFVESEAGDTLAILTLNAIEPFSRRQPGGAPV